MSSEVAPTSRGSWVHGVSVVPMTQYSSHGMMNSTDFSVWVMMPVSGTAGIRSRATVTWMPLEARTSRPASAPASSCWSWVQTPPARMTWRARTSNSSPLSSSRTRAPTTRSPSWR